MKAILLLYNCKNTYFLSKFYNDLCMSISKINLVLPLKFKNASYILFIFWYSEKYQDNCRNHTQSLYSMLPCHHLDDPSILSTLHLVYYSYRYLLLNWFTIIVIFQIQINSRSDSSGKFFPYFGCILDYLS